MPPLRSDVQGQDIEGTDAVVCVSGDSPAGNYIFTVTNVTPGAGGSTATGPNPAVVAKGTCFALVSRLAPEDDGNPSADPPSSVTFSYTSSDVVGATRTGTICVDDPGIPASSPCGATVTSYVNFVAGSVATFSFTSPAQMIEELRATIASLDLPKTIKHELDDRLRDAGKGVTKGHTRHACDQLDQFIKKLNEASKKKKIESEDAADILTEAEQIQSLLGC